MRELISRMIRAALAPYADEIATLRDEVEDLHRRAANLNRIGTCVAVDPASGRCQVSHGGNRSPWIKYFNPAAGETRETRHPSVGEQCLLLNYGAGDGSAQAMALTGLPSAAFPPVSGEGNVWRRTFKDGTTESYDHDAHRFERAIGSSTMTADRDGITLMHGGNGLRIDASGVHLVGSGVDHDGKDIGKTHKHGGVVAGNSKTDVPS